ncbi:MAG TPA: Gfo/Idh/MocA family oxidoreductase, partial [Candidatus Dormibacteraeota bacterium]|nr:Gfo/Idh/MocA family oxidoreductase [Candidatus Dormibacteraeota bacterium]
IRSAVLHAAASAGASRMFGVGLLGFGALGSAHGAAIAETDGLSLRCVCDISAGRREAAELHGVDTVADADALYQRDDVDVVLIGTPPVHHAAAALAALDAGKHVVCEKPFALTAADCDAVIDRAKAVDRVVTVFQNRRWDPDFVAVRDVVRSGAVGTLFEMESFVGGFGHPCHYWHSHEPISGGALFDWGSHYIDWMLQLFDAEVVRVACTAHKRVWHDVTNADHITVQLRFGDGATASFTHSHLAAAAKPKWYLLGTRGAVVADWDHAVRHVAGPDGELDEQPVAVTDLPARVRVLRPGPDGRSSEEALALPRRDRGAFYRNLAAHLRDGEPLAVPAQQARRTVAVLETATASAREGGRLIDTSI